MFSDQLPPPFPQEVGEENAVEFMKNGREYRLLRFDGDTWLIHARGRSADDFQLVLTPDGNRWILEGKNEGFFPYAAGVTKGEIFSKLF